MKTWTISILLALAGWAASGPARALADGPYARLTPVSSPKVVATAEEYPGGAFRTAHLLDGSPATEFASNGKGTATFVELDLGATVEVGGLRHVDRNDPANVATSRLTFLDAAGKAVGSCDVTHAGRRAGLTLFVLPRPVAARRVRWEVTRLADPAAACAGGAELTLFRAGAGEPAPRGVAIRAHAEPVVEIRGGKHVQPLTVELESPYGKPVDAVLKVEGQEPRPVHMTFGTQRFTFDGPVLAAKRPIGVSLVAGEVTLTRASATLQPARKTTVYLLPHSHVDIGYTHRQADVMRRQWDNIETALELARKTAGNPPGSRFKWNTEVLWAVDAYLQNAPPEKRERFVAAVRSGDVGLDALYGNELTGLCRPEELMRLMRWGASIGRRCGVNVESAMISDVPGLTWGTVTACAQAGVRYFSLGINYIDGGRTLPAWEDRPFYWVGPDGKSQVLCWLPYKGYALGHTGYKLAEQLPARLRELEAKGYPYDVVQLRWNVGGDNGPPDATLPGVVRAWNETHAWPKLVIATTAEAFRAMEAKHAGSIPKVAGDFSPYWENGACSTARETALNRTAAERLVQAETLAALLGPKRTPAADFNAAWRDVILYDEHTWGAHNSITEPDSPFVKDQWKVKQDFALDADRRSRALLARVLDARGAATPNAVDVFNTTSWARTDLVILDRAASEGRELVFGPGGVPARSQRLASGELAFLAADVPAFGATRYHLSEGTPPAGGRATASGTTLATPAVTVKVDPATGSVVSLYSATAGGELSDTRDGVGLNRYAYVLGDRVKDPKPAGPATVRVVDAGPLVATLRVESTAPGCSKLTRDVRVVDGIDRVDLVDVVDKTAVREKEGVHFGFAFAVPGGQVRVEAPWSVVRPDTDQIAGACKDWFCAGRWVDVSNADRGVTWATLDAPIVEVGGVTADKIGSVPDSNDWRAHVGPTQTVYSMVMNNHWHTNYKADQDGPTAFRYAMLPHRAYDPAEAQRFGVGCSQPLIAAAARGPEPPTRPFLKVDAPGVLVASVKPSEDRAAWVVRLHNPGASPAATALQWGSAAPKAVWVSNLAEDRVTPVNGRVEVAPGGVVTLRADLN